MSLLTLSFEFLGRLVAQGRVQSLPIVILLAEVAREIEAVGDRVAREEHEKFGDDVPTRAERPRNVVEPGVEMLEGVPVDFVHLRNAETHDALMVGLPDHGILITQDLVYNHVHAMVGEKAFDSWENALESGKALDYDKILPGHGAPGGKQLYTQMQNYLAVARDAYAQSKDGDDMKARVIQAFADYGGVGMLDQQKAVFVSGSALFLAHVCISLDG